MGTIPDESALQELTNRLAKLEQANADLQEKLATIQAEPAITGEQPILHRPGPPPPGPPGDFRIIKSAAGPDNLVSSGPA
jgi:hypothetical protein